jgi:dTMP kinase
MKRGKFIVLEGIDGSGTSTIANRLAEHYQSAVLTYEPTGRPVGELIRKRLKGEWGWNPPAETMALLFVADRMDHIANVIEPALAEGKWVISDRFMYSTMAYQSLTSERPRKEVIQWLSGLHHYSIEPDLVLIFNVDCFEAAIRRSCRDVPDVYEDDGGLQYRLARFYENIPEYADSELVAPGRCFVHIDANRPVDEVFGSCVRLISKLIGSPEDD